MAYRSFNQRFPKFKWILFLAILITLPLTVFSVQKVSTSTEQHAASATCTASGGTCYKYSCPNGYAGISGTCGATRDAECCYRLRVAPKNPTPTPHLNCAGVGTCSSSCNTGSFYPADDCHSGSKCCMRKL